MARIVVKELASIGAIKRGRFVLSSGKTSDIYIDLRLVPSHPPVFKLLLGLAYFLHKDIVETVSAIIGVATGGIPWAVGLGLLASKPVGYVRPQKKEHGRGRVVEADLPTRSSVLVVDDVATTGRSLSSAVDALRGEGYRVREALVIVDREEGARSELERKGVKLRYIITLSQLREALEDL
ncbi:MAG: orotate phosphoribosyltransferase [Desulfurococcales archaeon]|nr:orotate phosphoribosyltransferase [Desulfurococcales archaeon]